ncbi:hypothetical protein BDF22DRAFT_696213 [Syncephalis plumigaleata]|nr:hypothetical protein BDF22DRAFT_696213 [Syncephalis plumigaleata]
MTYETIVRQYLPMSSTNKEKWKPHYHSRVAVSLIEECMNSCKQLTLQKITASNYTAIEKINRPDYGASSFIPKEPNREWMLLAVVAQRGSVITDHEGNKSITLVLTDLKYSQCRLTLFDAALDAHWKTAPGSVVAMGLSISRLECLLNIGDCIDFSMCIAANKDGSKCRMPVDNDVSMQVPSSSFDNNKDSSAVNTYQSSNYYEATPFGRASKLSSKALQERQNALLKQHNNLGGIYLQSAIATHNERKKIKLAQEEEASANLAKNNTIKKSALAILENAKGRPVDKEL